VSGGEPLVETLGLLRLRELVEYDVAGGVEGSGCPDDVLHRFEVQVAVRVELFGDLNDEVAVLVLKRAAVVEEESGCFADGRHLPVVVEVAEPQDAAWLAGDERAVCLLALPLLVRACRFLRLEFGNGAGALGALEEDEVGAGVVEAGDVLPLVVGLATMREDDVMCARVNSAPVARSTM